MAASPIFRFTWPIAFERHPKDEAMRIESDEMKEREDMSGKDGFSTPRLRDLPRSGRILCIIGCAVGMLFSIIFLVYGLEELILVFRKPGTTLGDLVGDGVFALVPAIILGGGLIQFVKWFRTRGKRREARTAKRPQGPACE